MTSRQKWGQAARVGTYAAGSYLWLGLMFLLMLHEATPYLWGGLAGTVILFGAARTLDRQAFRRLPKRPPLSWGGSWGLAFCLVMVFIGGQVVAWRYFYFFYDPERAVDPKATIVSPADGFVVYVRPVKKGEVPLSLKEDRKILLSEVSAAPDGGLQEDGWLVGIFMTPLSVHVNRAPSDGVVKNRWYAPGSQMQSMMSLSWRTMVGQKPFEAGAEHILTNERETLLIEGGFPVYVTRIASPYVNKIVTWPSLGDPVKKGERIGLIKMGSQTDLLFPQVVNGQALRIAVQEGDYVRGGETPVAY